MQNILKIGLIGMGRIGKLHGDNITQAVSNAKIEAAVDIVMSEETKEWARVRGVEKISSDPMDVINDKDVDAVFICSATDSHADLIIQAARAGKHIFCEKPIHTDVSKIKKALSEVEKAGVKLQVGFVRRFDHNHKKVRDTVASGRLGRPHIIKVTSRDPAMQPIEYISTSGGIFMDMTIHDFDMVRYLSGSEVTEIMVYGSVMIDPEIEKFGDIDTAVILVKFENNAVGVIENSRAAHYGYDQRTEVHCDKGCVQVGNDLIDMSMISTAEGVFCEKPTWFFLERYNDAFISEVKEFTDAVLMNKDTPVSGNDGLMPVYIAMAAEKSLKEGRPVKITEVM